MSICWTESVDVASLISENGKGFLSKMGILAICCPKKVWDRWKICCGLPSYATKSVLPWVSWIATQFWNTYNYLKCVRNRLTNRNTSKLKVGRLLDPFTDTAIYMQEESHWHAPTHNSNGGRFIQSHDHSWISNNKDQCQSCVKQDHCIYRYNKGCVKGGSNTVPKWKRYFVPLYSTIPQKST